MNTAQNDADSVRMPANLSYEKIMSNPILDIGARFFDKEKYSAFKILYKPMRILDDLIDNRKSEKNELSQAEKEKFTEIVNCFEEAVNQMIPNGIIKKQILETISKFRIPAWPWKEFARAMAFDVHNKSFKTFQDFLDYAEGAAVAPSSIYIHICGSQKVNGRFSAPDFDIRKMAKNLALFSYLVHIIRDFQKDQKKGLNYFSEDLLKKNNLTQENLQDIANGGEISKEFRNLMKTYYDFAEHYRKESVKTLEFLKRHLEPKYFLSTQVIYTLYLQIFEKIDVENGTFSAEELNPCPLEVRERVERQIQANVF